MPSLRVRPKNVESDGSLVALRSAAMIRKGRRRVGADNPLVPLANALDVIENTDKVTRFPRIAAWMHLKARQRAVGSVSWLIPAW